MTLVSQGLAAGVDTHKDVHVAVVLDQLGHRLGVLDFPATDAGNERLMDWLTGLGQVTDAGVEGAGSYGYRLARLLSGRGLRVWEINCPDRSRRRRKGKGDPVDAENAARAVLADEATALPQDRRGLVAELRLLVTTRRSAVKARTRPATRSSPSWSMQTTSCATRSARCARHGSAGPAPRWSPPTGCAAPWPRWADGGWPWTPKPASSKPRSPPDPRARPRLLARHGVGPITAAQLLVTAGSNPGRLRGNAALAALCDASPVEASSGNTSRHRLNCGGDRAASNALWVIAHVRMLSDLRTRAYPAKRTAVGNNRKEIMRMLQRYIARERYPLIIDALRSAATLDLTWGHQCSGMTALP